MNTRLLSRASGHGKVKEVSKFQTVISITLMQQTDVLFQCINILSIEHSYWTMTQK